MAPEDKPGGSDPAAGGGTDRLAKVDPAKLEEAIGELGPYAVRFRELAARPPDLLAALRGDPAFAVAFARADTITHLRRWFTPRRGWQADKERSGPAGPVGVGVEWVFDGVHDGHATFNGLPATGRPVVVRGVTMAGVEEGRFKLRRYVDWAGLFAQLGLSLNWRVPVPSGPVPSGPGPGGGTTP
jgi:hypothetical protein